MSNFFQIPLAPEKLWQAINPWSFYNQGAQPGPGPGRIGDALEVRVDRLPKGGLTAAEKDALAILKGQLAEVRKVKQRERAGGDDAK